jgi:hypothetical protein
MGSSSGAALKMAAVLVLVLFAGRLLIAEAVAAAAGGAVSTRSWSLSSATKCNDHCIRTPEVDLYKCYTGCMDANREQFK